MDTLEIREATIADIPLIHRLAWEIFPATYQNLITQEQSAYMMEWMYSPASLERQLLTEGHRYFIAYWAGQAVGYVSVRQESEHLYHLEKLYVHSDFRHLKLGRKLFEHAVNVVRSMDSDPCAIELNVNRGNPALQFYLHMGMHIDRQGDFDIGHGYYMNDYIMRLEVLPEP